MMIDWMVHLPQELAGRFWSDLVQLEEERKMRYLTSIERMARDEGMAAGMQQGAQDGRRAGKQQVIMQMLASRFGELPPWANAKLQAATETEMDAWTTALLSANSLEALFGSPSQ